MIFGGKIKASALQLALFIGVVVILLLSGLILHRQVNFFFSDKARLVTGDQKRVEQAFFSAPSDTLQMLKEAYGGFVLQHVRAQGGYSKNGLVGSRAQENDPMLYLCDNYNPLALVGRARVEGGISIPATGIKAGVISGTYYYGGSLVNGPISYSTSSLPELDESMYKRPRLTNPRPLKELSKGVSASFSEAVKYYYSTSPVDLFESHTGNVTIESVSRVYIARSAQLTDVRVIAPVIELEDGFEGRVHLMASDSIIVGDRVSMVYPSSAMLYPKTSDTPAAIVLGEDTSIGGNLIYLHPNREMVASNILIPKTSTVVGGVYCNGYLEHYGLIDGQVYTDYFITTASGGRYINHLMDGQIKSSNPSLSSLPLRSTKTQPAQWLY